MTYELTIMPNQKGKLRTVIPFKSCEKAKARARGLSHLYCVAIVTEIVKGRTDRKWWYKNGFLAKETKQRRRRQLMGGAAPRNAAGKRNSTKAGENQLCL